jgi:hypothetical protein
MQQMKQNGQQPDFKVSRQNKKSQMMGDPNSYDIEAMKYYFANNIFFPGLEGTNLKKIIRL